MYTSEEYRKALIKRQALQRFERALNTVLDWTAEGYQFRAAANAMRSIAPFYPEECATIFRKHGIETTAERMRRHV